MDWKIEYFSEAVQREILALPAGFLARYIHLTDRMMGFGPNLGMPHISLHTVCHHAIYLDRTFNAAHYLQSEDRIHRLGLPPDQSTTIEIVECEGTVDQAVNDRLVAKVGRMAEALEDSSLRIDPLPIDIVDDPETNPAGMDEYDVEALIENLLRGS